MINVAKAKIDPAQIFAHPADVLHEASLTREEKIDILKSWEYDECELSVAEEENMRGSNGHANCLDEILQCLRALHADETGSRSIDTKHG
ncbi:MAG: putative cytosolic protein [uncultured bacterium]|nr:MAG: putative cytosolic protein [uncultured bacterium]OGT54204.1 MAG: hypothetical protein A3F43_01645 [Gammaproteobacteria bacterium RIFCSPHIGHO2_12_FULL_42_10]